MKATTSQPSRSSRMSIEVFDASLLKETSLMYSDDYANDNESDFDDNFITEIEEMSFNEFEKTLFE